MASQSSKSTSYGKTSDNLPVSNDTGFKSSLENKSNQAPSTANLELGAKKEGVVRIGLVGVRTTAAAEGINPEELSGAIQNTLSQYLKTPEVEVVTIDAKLAAAVDAEAKEKECDFVIYASAAHKKGGGGGMFGKVLGNMAGSTVSRIGYGNTAQAIARDAAATALYTAASLSASVKAKDEITLEIKVQAVEGGNAVLTRQYKQKAKSDGEDIVTPVVEQAAQAIVDAVAKS
jgi:hypothetical protein